MTDIEISCLPRDLPAFIEVDLLELNLNETLHLSDLKLPKGVENYALSHGGDGAQPIAAVHAPRAEEEEIVVEAEASEEAGEEASVEDDATTSED